MSELRADSSLLFPPTRRGLTLRQKQPSMLGRLVISDALIFSHYESLLSNKVADS